jgi:two-component system, NtrC family, sensor kinase
VRETGGRGRIQVRTFRDGQHVVIAVQDTGGGIPEDVRARMFDPFFTTKEVGKGTGQGLAIVRSVIVDSHGGEITFDTRMGQGTTFYLRLPIHGRPTPVAA